MNTFALEFFLTEIFRREIYCDVYRNQLRIYGCAVCGAEFDFKVKSTHIPLDRLQHSLFMQKRPLPL